MNILNPSARFTALFTVGLGLAFSLTIPAFAQEVLSQALPVQANPGLLTPNPTSVPLGEQLKKEEQTVTPRLEQPEINLDVPEPPSIVQLEGSQFHVNKINVQGNTLVSSRVLGPILVSYEGKDVTLNDLGQAVDKINEQYRKRGYLTSIAYIPPQDITSGTIVIRVLEGQVGDISVAGNKFYRTGIVARYLDQGTGDPLNIPKLEKNLRRINRQGDFRVRATLSPNSIAGKTDIKLDVEERQPLQVGLTFDNQGRPTIGTLRWGTEFINRNVSGIGDRFNARWIGAAGTQTALGSYFIPLNRYGTELGVTFGFTRVDVDLPKVRDDNAIIGKAFNYGVVLSQPLDREHTFVADAALNFRRVSSFYNGDRDQNQDDIRSLQFGLNYDKFDRWGRTFARIQSTVGTTWFGGNRQFWKTESLVNRVVRLPKNNFLILRSYAQMTPDALPPAEQFQLGGAYSVRGYTEGLLIGDRGFQFSVEHRWPVPGLHKVNPWLADRVQGATFFDYGRTWLDNSNRRSFRRDEISLASAGLGVRARLSQYMQGFVDFGFGMLDRSDTEPNAQPTARVHFGVRSDLLPDDYRTWGKDVARVNVEPRFKRSARKINEAKKTISKAKKPAAPKAVMAPEVSNVVKQ
jgi:hemolysin activation/secretion protein